MSGPAVWGGGGHSPLVHPGLSHLELVSTDSPNAREIAQRLMAKASDRGGRRASSSETLAARTACETAHDGLVRWLGPGGTRALFARAFADAEPDHPILEQLHKRYGQSGNLAEAAKSLPDADDSKALGAALNAVLVALLELLGRLVGQDMAERIVEPIGRNSATYDETSS